MQNARHHALDHLRVFIIFLVVLLHASLSYMAYAPEWWYVLDPGRSLFFTAVVLIVDVPIMLIMFFLSGYFTYPSLASRGAGRFMRDKLIRIGIPWVFGSLVLAPPTAYMIYFSRGVPMTLGTFWRTDFWGKAYQQSVYWYLGVLLLLFALTALAFVWSRRFATWRRAVVRPTALLFTLFLVAMTVSSLAIGLRHPLDEWSHNYLLVYQPVRAPLYFGYFALGVFAQQRGWFSLEGYAPSIARWLPSCLGSGLLYLGWRLILAPAAQPTLAAAVMIILFNLFCFTSLMASIAVFRTHAAEDSGFWRSQARNSYGIYYLHPLVLYPLALVLVPFPVSIYLKAAAITLLAYLSCWGLSAGLLTRLPGLRRMF